jgi:hypothetical protein
MPLPEGYPTFTLVGEYAPLSEDGPERTGHLRFTPVPPVLVAVDEDVILLGTENATLNASGGFEIELVAAADGDFLWRIDEFVGVAPRAFHIQPGAAGSTVALSSVVVAEPLDEDYVVVTGPAGPPGQDGTPGTTYTHIQTVPSATWQIAHGLGRIPNISLIIDGQVSYADIEHPSTDLAVITLPSPFAGTATCS